MGSGPGAASMMRWTYWWLVWNPEGDNHTRRALAICFTDELKARFNAEVAEGFLPMREAIRALGVSRQTVLQRVKRGELEAVHVTRGRQKGLRIKVIARQGELFA